MLLRKAQDAVNEKFNKKVQLIQKLGSMFTSGGGHGKLHGSFSHGNKKQSYQEPPQHRIPQENYQPGFDEQFAQNSFSLN